MRRSLPPPWPLQACTRYQDSLSPYMRLVSARPPACTLPSPRHRLLCQSVHCNAVSCPGKCLLCIKQWSWGKGALHKKWLPHLSTHASCAGEVESGADFLVKWTGRSHLHNEWVPQGQLARLAKRKLDNFRRRCGAAPCNFADPAWSQVQHTHVHRSLALPASRGCKPGAA